MIAIIAAGAVLALVVVGGAAYFIFRGDGSDDSRTVGATESRTSDPPPPPSATPPSPSPSTSATDISGVLEASMETARGNTYRRLATRSGSCTTYANSELRSTLRTRPCSDRMQTALYANSSRTALVSISILPVSRTDAAAISRATNSKAAPTLLLPPAGSGLPRLKGSIPYWTSSWSQGRYVVYAQAFTPKGGDPGKRRGTVHQTGRELGIEVKNVLIWKG